MSKRKTTKPPTIRDEVAQLRKAIEHLAQHVEILRIAIDDARDEFAWATRNHRICAQATPPMPVAHEPDEQVELDSQIDSPKHDESPDETPSKSAGNQGKLFDQ